MCLLQVKPLALSPLVGLEEKNMGLMRGRELTTLRDRPQWCMDPSVSAVFFFVLNDANEPKFCLRLPGMSLSVCIGHPRHPLSLLIAYIHQTDSLLPNLP